MTFDWNLLLDILSLFVGISLVSIGGANAVLPDIKRQVVEVNGWMTEPTFANLFAISHAAPGPNVIMVSLIGWHIAGGMGLLVATVGILAPSSLLAFAVTRAVNRYADHSWVSVAKQGLVPIAVGLILASGVAMMRAADHNALLIVISLTTAGFMVLSRRNPLWALAACTLVYMAAVNFNVVA